MSAAADTAFAAYGRLRRDGEGWSMENVAPHVCIRLKQLFPRIGRTDTAPFRFDGEAATAADLTWFLARYPMVMSDADRDALDGGRLAFEAGFAARERILSAAWAPGSRATPPGLRTGKALRDYQAQAVALLEQRAAGAGGGLLVGDEVGLGKTVIGAGACLLPGALPAVGVVQPHVHRQWVEALREFTDLRICAIATTRPYDLPPADVYLFRYSNLAGWVDVVARMPVGLAFWDEVQELRRGPESQKGAASMSLATKARMRLGLTATPVYNYGVEIWNLMRFIDPGVLGAYGEFLREWGAGGGKIEDPKALGTYLREQHAFIRRTRDDVGRALPPVNRVVDYVDYDSEVMGSVDSLARHLALRAVSGSFTERGQATRELDLRVRQATGVAKAARVADYVRILVEAGEPVVLAGWHREVYDVWNERLADLRPAMYTGSETAAVKDRAKDRFIAGDTDILIMSLRSGAGLEGLQNRCRTVVFGELDWSPGIHHQVIGRLDRDRDDGTAQQVLAVFLVTDEGSDPPMMETLGLKASEQAQIVDPLAAKGEMHSDGDHLKRLVERYLKRSKDRLSVAWLEPAADGTRDPERCAPPAEPVRDSRQGRDGSPARARLRRGLGLPSGTTGPQLGLDFALDGARPVADGCAWIGGGEGCDARAVEGSYCARHAEIVYRAPEAPEKAVRNG